MTPKRRRAPHPGAPAVQQRPAPEPRLLTADAPSSLDSSSLGSSSLGTRAIETSHGTLAVVQSVGTRLPVLFVHGNSGAKEVFTGQLHGPLARSHRLVAVDLPGHGASEDAQDPQTTYAIPGYADAICQVLEALDIEQVVLVGWSLGGHVAMEMIASMPGVVGAFVMSTPPLGRGIEALTAAFRPHPALSLLGRPELDDGELLTLAAAAAGPALAPAMVPAMRRTDGRARACLHESLLAGRYEDETAVLREPYDVPVALVVGEDDPFVNAASVRDVAADNLWGGRCHLIPGAGHAPFLDAPSIVNHLLAKFLGEMDVRAARLRENPPLAMGG